METEPFSSSSPSFSSPPRALVRKSLRFSIPRPGRSRGVIDPKLTFFEVTPGELPSSPAVQKRSRKEEGKEEEAGELLKEQPSASPKRARLSKSMAESSTLTQPTDTFITPPHTRRVSHIGTGPSPWCQSERSHGCIDPRVLKSSLDYGYRGLEKVVSCDPWHTQSLKVIKEIFDKNTRFFSRKNIALASFHIIYEHEGKFHVSDTIDLHILFVSGGKRITEELRLDAPSLNGQRLEVKSVYDFLAIDGNETRVTKQMRTRLLQLYSDTAGTKLCHSTAAARRKEVDFPYVSPLSARKTKSRPNSAFERAYLHSEQALLVYLCSQTQFLATLLTALPQGAVIHQMAVLIASLKQMCRQCGATFFRASEGGGTLKDTLSKYITEFPEKGFQVKESGLELFTEVSGLKVFDNVNLEHRQKQWAKAHEQVTDSSAFIPHVLQRCLPQQLTKKQRDALQKTRLSDPAIAQLCFDDDDDHDD